MGCHCLLWGRSSHILFLKPPTFFGSKSLTHFVNFGHYSLKHKLAQVSLSDENLNADLYLPSASPIGIPKMIKPLNIHRPQASGLH